MMTHEGVPYIRMFTTSPGVRVVYYTLAYLNTLCRS